ncbi:hypothetical protein B0187_02825 [Haemophilus paracuniculus]|uniref:Opacity-associated protein A LysM-like domain-containing protein n=1 Tax=Haemophilus paracuniculus TaxID=734 RepID=A0A1T0ATG7_9PAST|nr:LysM-like peptidoglycan-binding domain-containing protein [Haemophilus paracuniculus]OOR99758.1 hypothetical protein B0187_02825 [Haemophilus paracuniculus]
MNQKNRIEPTFGNASETPRPNPTPAENAESTLERISKSSEVLASLAPKEPKVETAEVKTEVKSEQKPTISPFVSMKTNNAPAHTFSQPLNRPASAIQNNATFEEMQQARQAQPAVQPTIQATVQPTAQPQIQPAVQPSVQATANVAQPQMTAQPQSTPVQAAATVASGAISANSAPQPATQRVEPTEMPAVKPSMDRVIPAASGAASSTKEDKQMPKVPSKFRRILTVILLALLGGVAFWLLKPNTPQTVAELENQPQGNSLPIEFRPVNEEEAKAAEAREAEALAQQQAQQQEQQAQSSADAQPTQQADSSVTISGDNNATIGEPAQTASQGETAQTDNGITISQDEVVANQNGETTTPAVAPVKQPTVKVVKPNSQGSVIYQPERNTKAKAEKTATVEKKAEQPKIKAMTAAEYKAKVEKNARMDQLIQNVESGKPAVAKVTPAATAQKVVVAPAQKVVATAAPAQPVQKVVATAAPAQSDTVVASKTMTVPKSVSLMQVFRDNGLNISDVNAMSRANGIVSNLKVNEKITVRLDKNNRVVEMNIGSGGRFTRQADGSYRFK